MDGEIDPICSPEAVSTVCSFGLRILPQVGQFYEARVLNAECSNITHPMFRVLSTVLAESQSILLSYFCTEERGLTVDVVVKWFDGVSGESKSKLSVKVNLFNGTEPVLLETMPEQEKADLLLAETLIAHEIMNTPDDIRYGNSMV
ncbi:MAG: hypothetical protein JSS82_00070 [Bacteroidetes bacterium]|nr:hypothetical protein [Bacteroidota bacterium]